MTLLDDGYAALADIRVASNADEEIGCHLFLHARPTRQRRDTWHRISADPELTAILLDAGKQSLWDIEARVADEQSLHEFDFDAMADGSVGLLRVEDAPGLGEWLAQVPAADLPTVYDGDEELLNSSRFYVFRLSFPDGRTLTAFRGRRGMQVAARQRNAIAAMFARDTQELVPVNGTVVSFDQAIDFFEWEGLVFILNMPTFESVTNIREVTNRKAFEAIDALANRFNLGDSEALKAHIGQRTRLGKKLAAAHRHGLAGDINPAVIEARIETKGLALRCQVDGDQVNFDIDHASRREVEDFVDLMTDVFLVSPLTSREWVAVVKKPPRPR